MLPNLKACFFFSFSDKKLGCNYFLMFSIFLALLCICKCSSYQAESLLTAS